MQHVGQVQVQHGLCDVERSVQHGLVVELARGGAEVAAALERVAQAAPVAVLQDEPDLREERGGMLQSGQWGWEDERGSVHGYRKRKVMWNEGVWRPTRPSLPCYLAVHPPNPAPARPNLPFSTSKPWIAAWSPFFLPSSLAEGSKLPVPVAIFERPIPMDRAVPVCLVIDGALDEMSCSSVKL